MKPTTPQVLPLVKALYGRDPVGCCLHIVLDDGNLNDSHVQSCLEYAQGRKHAECEHLANLILKMSRSQRFRLSQEK